MSAIVELSNQPCHFCGETETTYKTKIKSQDLQAVLCNQHLKQMLQQEQSTPQVAASTVGQGADGKRNRLASGKDDATDDERTVTS